MYSFTRLHIINSNAWREEEENGSNSAVLEHRQCTTRITALIFFNFLPTNCLYMKISADANLFPQVHFLFVAYKSLVDMAWNLVCCADSTETIWEKPYVSAGMVFWKISSKEMEKKVTYPYLFSNHCFCSWWIMLCFLPMVIWY